MRFSVYKHTLVLEDGRLMIRQFIVLKDDDGDIVRFTDFHKYCKPRSKFQKLMSDGGKRTTYVCRFLNYCFFEKYHVDCLCNITADMVKDFINDYGRGTLPGDTKKRTAQSVKTCMSSIMDFIDSLSEKNKTFKLNANELMKVKTIRNKKGKVVQKIVPAFDVIYDPEMKVTFRDIPETVFYIVLEEIIENHPELAMSVALSAFAGLRPSETLCVRREDSVLGPGLLFDVINGETVNVTIDLKKEMNLRSDLVSTGRIKKERMQRVYPTFLPNFMSMYNRYMDFLEGRKYEKEYGPLIINRSGKAMTYASYSAKIRDVFYSLKDRFLMDEDTEVVEYAKMLDLYSVGPHIFRHWFTVQLVLAGEDISSIQYWRGDKSPLSAQSYINNKSALEKRYKAVSNEATEFEMWRAKKIYGENI